MSQAIREKALLMGPRQSLLGIVSPAAPDTASEQRPVFVILNSGIIHRVGANRMSVLLARSLARAGYNTVRFDQSGIGDSEPRTDGLEPLEAGLADVGEALDSLESKFPGLRVVLVGLCLGANLSALYAPRDPRVVGMVLMDPWLPSTPRHWLLHYKQRAIARDAWLNVLRGKNPLWLAAKRRILREPEEDDEPGVDKAEARGMFEAAYRDAVAARIRMLTVLSGDNSYYREHLLDAFENVSFGELLQLEHFPRSDHTFALEADRDQLIGMVVDWAKTADFAPRGNLGA